MNSEIRKKIMFTTNCSYAKININIVDDQEFINQFSYKYNLRIFEGDKIIFKSVYTSNKAIPLDLYIEGQNIHKGKNEGFLKQYGQKPKTKKYEGYEEINKILKLKDNQNGDKSVQLLSYFIYNEFNMKMSLEELSENEKIMYSTGYSYGQVNYLREKRKSIKKARAYDINSEHPYLMYDENLRLPMRRGKELKLNDINEIDLSKVGLYLLNIEFNEQTKYFKPITPKKFYTVSNYFIEILNKTNTKYTMYNEDLLTFNSIVYENDDCINLNSVIGYQISKLYDRKKTLNCKISKKLLQKLLGTFSTKCGDREPISSKEERIIYNTCWIKCPNLFFRFKNFIYDMCRVNLYNKYIKYCNDNDITIYRIKADSIHISNKLSEELIDEKRFGFMKYEGIYSLKNGLKNINDVSYKKELKTPEINIL